MKGVASTPAEIEASLTAKWPADVPAPVYIGRHLSLMIVKILCIECLKPRNIHTHVTHMRERPPLRCKSCASRRVNKDAWIWQGLKATRPRDWSPMPDPLWERALRRRGSLSPERVGQLASQ